MEIEAIAVRRIDAAEYSDYADAYGEEPDFVLGEASGRSLIFGAIHGEELLGVCTVDIHEGDSGPTYFMLGNLHVREGHRKMGIGTLLISHVREMASMAGVGVAADANDKSFDIFAHAGFRDMGNFTKMVIHPYA